MNPRERPTPQPSPLPPLTTDHQSPSPQLRPYPRYQPSGVEWLGEIPAGWRVHPLKRLVTYVSRGISPEYDIDGIPVLNQACIQWNRLVISNSKFHKEASVSQRKGLLQRGDVLVNSTGTGTLGRAAVFNQQGTWLADSHITIIRLNQELLSSRYLSYLLMTPVYQGYVYASIIAGATNQIELNRSKLLTTSVILPPPEEQRAIAAYLDRETVRIDRILAHHEKMIELLEEQRTSIISRAVTRGLHDDVPLKVSGVDWLGEIPAHWEILRLKYIALQVTTKQVGKEEEHTYIGLEQIEGSTGRLLLNSLVDKVDSTTSVFIGGDILFGKLRPYLAKVVQPHFAGVCTTELLVLRPSKGTSNRFLFYQLLSEPLIKLVNSMTYGTKMPRVSTEQLTNITLPVPPLQEQRAIAAHLDRAAGDIDATISQVRSQIDLLREYRATLITSVVTGKVDVSSLL